MIYHCFEYEFPYQSAHFLLNVSRDELHICFRLDVSDRALLDSVVDASCDLS